MQENFFGKDGDISRERKISKKYKNYNHLNIDIVNYQSLKKFFKSITKNKKL